MAGTADLIVRIRGDVADVNTKIGKFGDAIKGAAVAMVAFKAADFIKDVTQLAVSAEEAGSRSKRRSVRQWIRCRRLLPIAAVIGYCRAMSHTVEEELVPMASWL